MPMKKQLNTKVVAIPEVGEGGGGGELSSTPDERTAEPGLEGGEETPEVQAHEGGAGAVVTAKQPQPGEGAPAPQGTGGKAGAGVQHRKRIERPDED